MRKKLLAAIYADDLFELIYAQRRQIRRLLEADEQRELQHARYMRDLLVQFRDAVEHIPDEELLAHLEAAVMDMSDQVARMEEQRV